MKALRWSAHLRLLAESQGVNGLCPAGESYAKHQMSEKAIPVLYCEGIRTADRPQCFRRPTTPEAGRRQHTFRRDHKCRSI